MSDPNAPAPRGLLNWWQGLILAISSALIGVAGAVAVIKGPGASSSGPSWAMMILRFVPHFLMLFGVLADAFTYEGVYWTGTMVGVVSIFAGPMLDYIGKGFMGLAAKLFSKGTPAAAPMQRGGEYPGCEIMSETAVEAGSPQTLTVTASILSYYILDLVTNLSLLDAAGAIVAGVILFAGQVAAISDAACVKNRVAMAAFMSGMYGLIIGGISFMIIGSVAPNFLPSTVLGGSAGGPGRKGADGKKEGMGLSSGSALAGGTGARASASTCT